jgi:hypothetical protein
MSVGSEPAGFCYRLSFLACAAIRCRLRFLTDRRRRFMPAASLMIFTKPVTCRSSAACFYIELINAPFLYEHKGSPAEYKAGLDLAIAPLAIVAAKSLAPYQDPQIARIDMSTTVPGMPIPGAGEAGGAPKVVEGGWGGRRAGALLRPRREQGGVMKGHFSQT